MSEKIIFTPPTLEHCKIISQEIENENKQNPHMIPQSAEQLFDDSYQNGGTSIIHKSGKLVGFIKLAVTLNSFSNQEKSVYEYGGLYVLPSFRGQGYGGKLLEQIVQQYHDRMMYCVTNVPSVKHIMNHLKQTSVSIENIPPDLQEAIEAYGKLVSGDEIFINKTLQKNL